MYLFLCGQGRVSCCSAEIFHLYWCQQFFKNIFVCLQTRKHLVGFQRGNSIMWLFLCSWVETRVSEENNAVIFRVNCKELSSLHDVVGHIIYLPIWVLFADFGMIGNIVQNLDKMMVRSVRDKIQRSAKFETNSYWQITVSTLKIPLVKRNNI